MKKEKNKATALLFVLTMLLIVILFANIAFQVMLSQSRLTYHNTARIQAYYAAQAAMVYALDQVRSGTWGVGLCPAPCVALANGCSCSFPSDPDMPLSVRNGISVITSAPNGNACATGAPLGTQCCIRVTANYTAPQ